MWSSLNKPFIQVEAPLLHGHPWRNHPDCSAAIPIAVGHVFPVIVGVVVEVDGALVAAFVLHPLLNTQQARWTVKSLLTLVWTMQADACGVECWILVSKHWRTICVYVYSTVLRILSVWHGSHVLSLCCSREMWAIVASCFLSCLIASRQLSETLAVHTTSESSLTSKLTNTHEPACVHHKLL